VQNLTALVRAFGTLTSSGVFTDTQTVVVGGKTYTTQTSLTNVDGNVLIGANAAATLANLKAAINLGAGAGTVYATAMTENAHVKATTLTATTLKVVSRVPGAIGNLIATTETQTNASWGGAVLASGSGTVAVTFSEILAAGQLAADVYNAIYNLDDASIDIS
jgi:hypothetical protein